MPPKGSKKGVPSSGISLNDSEENENVTAPPVNLISPPNTRSRPPLVIHTPPDSNTAGSSSQMYSASFPGSVAHDVLSEPIPDNRQTSTNLPPPLLPQPDQAMMN